MICVAFIPIFKLNVDQGLEVVSFYLVELGLQKKTNCIII